MQETRNKKPATLEQRSGNGYNAVMSKKAKSEKTHHHPLLECFSPDALAEAEEFLARIDERRQAYEPDSEELSPLRQSLIARIKAAFSGVTCYREPRMLLGGEAEDDYLSPDAQALLTPLEERDDWEDIPDDLLHACSCALSYVGPHAYRFLIPRFMVGALHNVVDIYPGSSPTSDLEVFARWKMYDLSPEQQQCLTDFLNLECVEADDPRDQFLPWEHDEYRAEYADHMDYLEYGALLVQRYAEREGIKA